VVNVVAIMSDSTTWEAQIDRGREGERERGREGERERGRHSLTLCLVVEI
jgi:hypothetical protein